MSILAASAHEMSGSVNFRRFHALASLATCRFFYSAVRFFGIA